MVIQSNNYKISFKINLQLIKVTLFEKTVHFSLFLLKKVCATIPNKERQLEN